LTRKNVFRCILCCILIAFIFQYVALFGFNISKPYTNYTYNSVILCGSRDLYVPVAFSDCEDKTSAYNVPPGKQMKWIVVLFLYLCIAIYFYFKYQYIIINRREIVENLLSNYFHESKYKSVSTSPI